jgi:phosphoglycerate kinase
MFINQIDVAKKRVILRCDFNVSIKNNQIISDEKILSSLETINYLINKKSKIIIMSHLGKIKNFEDTKNNSLFIVYGRLCELLKTKVIFSSATRGRILEEKIASLNYGEVLLMENTRFEDLNNQAESKCSSELSQYWASLADIFINDAFGISHRKHASNYGITKYLPSAYGFLIEKEIKGLDIVLNPHHPFTVFMGGAKIEDKIDLINKILPKCDYLLLGGAIANSFVSVNHNVGLSLYNKDKYTELKKILLEYPDKIILPKDFLVLNNNQVYTRNIDEINDEDVIYDIGTRTIDYYQEILNNSETIFLNGTAGKYEDNNFEEGTKKILKTIANSRAESVIGGGDAISSADYFKITGFTFISTGGGATLNYIAGGHMKCADNSD